VHHPSHATFDLYTAVPRTGRALDTRVALTGSRCTGCADRRRLGNEDLSKDESGSDGNAM
jgi:hypothetical protein